MPGQLPPLPWALLGERKTDGKVPPRGEKKGPGKQEDSGGFQRHELQPFKIPQASRHGQTLSGGTANVCAGGTLL